MTAVGVCFLSFLFSINEKGVYSLGNITTSNAKVTYQAIIAKGMTDLWLYCPEIATLSKCGQFVQVRCEGHVLRRPISICAINKHSIRIVFEVRGEGTKWMSTIKLGDTLDILGPLGHGFELGDTSRQAVFVGGGIGVPPLLAASKPFGKNATVVLGFRNSDAAILVDDFKANGATVLLASDDGSLGFHGLVTVPLAEHLQNNHADIFFTCGPNQCLWVLQRSQKKRRFPVKSHWNSGWAAAWVLVLCVPAKSKKRMAAGGMRRPANMALWSTPTR